MLMTLFYCLPGVATVNRATVKRRQFTGRQLTRATDNRVLFHRATYTSPGAQSCDVLYDSVPGDDRMILMGCAELLDGLAQADLCLADETFKVVPNVFFQLYSIHFDFGSGIHPAALYCLLLTK